MEKKQQFGDFIVLENGSLEVKEEAAGKLVKQMYKQLSESGENPNDWKIELIHKEDYEGATALKYPYGTVALKWTRR